MAPILLKIKGTKLFSPFNEIEDVGDLSTLWRVCTKVKDSLENGSRLENLSWRLWHLHQTLEARGKGRDYRKLSPATTKQLEKTIRRPEYMKKQKPMQIKVRLGKSTDRPAAEIPRAPGSTPSPANGQIRPQAPASTIQAARGSGTATTIPNSSKAGIGADAHATGITASENERLEHPTTHAMEAIYSAFGNASVDRTKEASAIAGKGRQHDGLNGDSMGNTGAVADALASAALATTGSFVSDAIASSAVPNELLTSLPHDPDSADISAINTSLGGDGNSTSISNGAATTINTGEANGNTSSNAQQTAAGSEEVQASDFMSFGPSSFLSSGFDLDAPQIEITLDDIFSANSGDWSQFGFASIANGPVLGMPMADYGTGQGMWNGMPYPGPMSMNTPYGMPSHMHMPHQETPKKQHDGPICANCGVTSTPLWRRSIDDTLLCNACGLYYKLHNAHRPKSLRSNASRKEILDEDLPKTVCTNCETTTTPLWRRDEAGSPLCNACGLYYKLHKENRPIKLKSDVIRKRQRHDPASTTPRKRQQSRGSAKQAATVEAGEGSADESSVSPTPATSAEPLKSSKAVSASRSKKKKSKPTAQSTQASSPTTPSNQDSSSIALNGDMPPALSASLSREPTTPQSAPPVSYSANGTQLLNGPEAHTSLGRSYHNYVHTNNGSRILDHGEAVQQRQSASTNLTNTALHPSEYRKGSTASEYNDMSYHFNTSVSSDVSSRPPPLQHSATLPIRSYDTHGYSSSTSLGLGSNNGGAPRTSNVSINIPMSPPLVARADTYFGRTATINDRSTISHDPIYNTHGTQLPLPSLGSPSHSSTGRYSSGLNGIGGAGPLHSTSSFQPSGSSAQSIGLSAYGQHRQQQQQHQSLQSRHQSPLYAGQEGHGQGISATTTSLSSPASEIKHYPDRQLPLPSLAELASTSSAHNSDSFRYTRQQQQQQSYPQLNP